MQTWPSLVWLRLYMENNEGRRLRIRRRLP